MGLFRALNTLQAIEANNGTDLQAVLSGSTSKSAEFAALLSTRHMARRMAGNPITMTAINASEKAIEIVFEQTTELNAEPIKEIAKNSGAMASASITLASLNAVTANVAAFGHFSTSAHYETNILNILSIMIGDPVGTHASLGAMIANTTAMNAITVNAGAVTALAASTLAMAQVVLVGAAVASLAGNAAATLILANSSIAVLALVGSTLAIDNLTDAARAIVVGVPSALVILGTNHDGWQYILDTSTTLDNTIYDLLIGLNGLDTATYANVASIFANGTASEIVANSHPSVQAIIAETDIVKYHPDSSTTSAMDAILASANLVTFLGADTAMHHIAEHEATMNTLIGNATAFPLLLNSAVAKTGIFASTTLVATMLTTGSDSLATVQGLAQSITVVNDALIGTFKTVGVAGKIIILTGVMGSIVATTLDNTFRSGDDAGTEATFALPGTSLSSGPIDILLPFTDAKWDINSIAATAAGNVTITYADFN
tara:strand:- start:9643 stop:11109 length:1467 start_codon:yes stop_codon:yes gene_type:complete